MKRLFSSILFTLILSVVAATAQSLALDSLIQKIQRRGSSISAQLEVGHLNVRSYTIGTSHCSQRDFAGQFFPHLLPFSTNPKSDIVFEAFAHVNYQWPGVMHLNVSALHSNQQKKGKRVMEEIFQGLLPIYAIQRRDDYGSNKSHILPFYKQGNKKYTYELKEMTDSMLLEARTHDPNVDLSHVCCIAFHPKRSHHSLLDGYVLVDSTSLDIVAIQWKGKLDMARFVGQLYFAHDSVHTEYMLPHYSKLDIHYKYAGTLATNSYQTLFTSFDATPLNDINVKSVPYNLTPYYEKEDVKDLDFDKLRPMMLPEFIDTIIDVLPQQTHAARTKSAIEHFSESLVDGGRIGSKANSLRIYGPLDPASFGYDQFNGFTFREKLRWTCHLSKNREIYFRGEFGYAFGLKELRFKTFFEYTYLPAKRGRWKLELNRNNSTFSSKFINKVNDELKNRAFDYINFDSLGIEYYQRYELKLEHGIELRNGLMLYSGILNTYRTPVKSGPQQLPEESRKDFIDTHYSDIAPYLRLEWTPRQYYWFNKGYKEYIDSPSPTFTLEVARAIPGLLNSDSNYGRIEFDASQWCRLGRTHSIAYRFGMGKFFNRKGEYFINYQYFNRSQYPSAWQDDRVGGTFHLLDDPWYSSSKAYIQAHFMLETPFGLFHQFRPISRFIIKERIYSSHLWAEGKPAYSELGYGIDNNYFNIGFFVGFKDAEYYSAGFRIRLEIGRHL